MQTVLILLAITVAATATLFSLSPNYTISYSTSHSELAHAHYSQNLNTHGMNYLQIYTNPLVSTLEQHHAAGFLEGYTTYLEIQSAYLNYQNFRLKTQSLSPKLQTFINSQFEFIDTMAARFPRDLYWQTAYNYLEQCRYIYRGFLTRLHTENRLDLTLPFSNFYYLTNAGDLRELIPALNS